MKKQSSFLSKKRKSNDSSKKKLIRKKSSKSIKIRGPWSEKEDKLLLDWIEKNGPKHWARCAETIKGRNGKQCREHWNNSLNNNIKKGLWSSEEDLYIMVFYNKLSKSWKKMIPLFKSRTENAIKNRFFSQLRKIAAKHEIRDRKEYNSKIKLGILLKYYDKGVEEAKKDFLKENPMEDNMYNLFIKDVENLIKSKPKNQDFIELDYIRKKYFPNYEDKKNDKEKINNKNEIEIKINIDENETNNEILNNDNKVENEDKNKNNNETLNNVSNNNNINNDEESEKNVNSISANSITEEEVNNNKKNFETNININQYYTNNINEFKKYNENYKAENKSTYDKALGTYYYSNNNNNKIFNNINELKNNLNRDINNINGQNNFNNLNINFAANNYINIYNNNNYLNNNMNNAKENNNFNTINYNIPNNFNLDLSMNKSCQNSASFLRKPSEVGDYKKNNLGGRRIDLKNIYNNNDFAIDSPFLRNNSNSYIDYNINPYSNYNTYYNSNIFKPMNSNADIFNYDRPYIFNKEIIPTGNNAFRHMDSNELNKINRTSCLFPPFGYKRSTSFGSNIEGKIYENNN